MQRSKRVDNFFKTYTQGAVPTFLGTFESLLIKQLSYPKLKEEEYIQEISNAYGAGVEEGEKFGVEKGTRQIIKDVVLGGSKQYLIPEKGPILGFESVKELYEKPEITPMLTETMIEKEIKDLEQYEAKRKEDIEKYAPGLIEELPGQHILESEKIKKYVYDSETIIKSLEDVIKNIDLSMNERKNNVDILEDNYKKVGRLLDQSRKDYHNTIKEIEKNDDSIDKLENLIKYADRHNNDDTLRNKKLNEHKKDVTESLNKEKQKHGKERDESQILKDEKELRNIDGEIRANEAAILDRIKKKKEAPKKMEELNSRNLFLIESRKQLDDDLRLINDENNNLFNELKNEKKRFHQDFSEEIKEKKDIEESIKSLVEEVANLKKNEKYEDFYESQTKSSLNKTLNDFKKEIVSKYNEATNSNLNYDDVIYNVGEVDQINDEIGELYENIVDIEDINKHYDEMILPMRKNIPQKIATKEFKEEEFEKIRPKGTPMFLTDKYRLVNVLQSKRLQKQREGKIYEKEIPELIDLSTTKKEYQELVDYIIKPFKESESTEIPKHYIEKWIFDKLGGKEAVERNRPLIPTVLKPGDIYPKIPGMKETYKKSSSKK